MRANYSEFHQFDTGEAVEVRTRTAVYFGRIISNKAVVEELDIRTHQSARRFGYAEIVQITPSH